MKTKLVNFLTSYYTSLPQGYIGLIATIIYLSGIGRFRFILFIALFFITYSILLAKRQNIDYFKMSYAPFLLISLYFDIKLGPIFPLFSSNSVIVAIFSYFALKYLLDSRYKKIIENITNYKIFTCCPRCNTETTYFTNQCSRCNYSQAQNDDSVSFQNAKDDTNNIGDISLNMDEIVRERICLSYLSHASLYKNGSILDRTEFVITNMRILLNSSSVFNRGISYLDEIPLSDITNVKIKERMHRGLKMHIITFMANGDTFELFQIHKRAIDELSRTVQLLQP